MSSNVQPQTNDLQASMDPASGEWPLFGWFADSRTRKIVFWSIVGILGFLQIWSRRLLVDHDGVAYLDIAENYARGAWSAALNAYYSPLYSWLMALAFLLKFPRSWESTILHLINFIGYLGAFASFEFFLCEFLRKEKTEAGDQTLPEGAWHILGLGLFLYTSLFMANVSGSSGQGDGSTPDIFVVLFVYLAAGLLMRMLSGRAQASTYGAFGIALAFGYFAKTAMFPLSFVFLAVGGFISLRQRKAAFLLAPVCFALLAGPWIFVLSRSQARFTFGDNGRLSYRWLVADRANWPEWGGQTEKEENLIHPPRQLSENPPIYEFATPVPGTFPLWYGSSYWLQGWKFHLSPVGQKRTLRDSYNRYRNMLDNQREYLALLLFLIIVQGAALQYFKGFLRRWVLWLPAIAALGMYALVWVEPRYVAAFVALTWISLFAAVKLPGRETVRQLAAFAVVATVLASSVNTVHGAFHDFRSVLHGTRSEQFEVAAGLHKLGVLDGQTLATIGIPRDSFYWARLAGVRVITEIPTPNVNQYWFGSPATQERVRSVFAQTGAVAIVTDVMPSEARFLESGVTLNFPGWQRIGNTSYFFFSLRDGATAGRAAVTKVLTGALVVGKAASKR